MRRIRVAHVINTLRPGGAEQLLLTTVEHLDPARFDSVVLALSPPLDLRVDIERLGVTVHDLGVRGPLDWRRGILGLARVLRRYRPDIVHTHLLEANVFGRVAAVLAGWPAVLTTLHHLDFTHWHSGSVLFRGRKLFERLAGPAINAGYVAVSRAVRDDYVRHFGLKDVVVIYNYVDTLPFANPDPATVEAARSSIGLTGKEFVLLNVARLHWEKGQAHLLDAMPRIIRHVPEARLLLAGDGPERAPLRLRARALSVEESVTFLGNRRDIPSILALADVFVFPSVAEGLGIAMLEAMAAGRAVVASGVEGIAEVVEDGKDGVLIPPANVEALADAIISLYADGDRRRRLGEAARRVVEERFSAPTGVATLSALYERVVGRHR